MNNVGFNSPAQAGAEPLIMINNMLFPERESRRLLIPVKPDFRMRGNDTLFFVPV
jgi:hypothetical protein